MRGDMLLMKALPFAVLSASLAMVACDSSSDTNESNDNNPAIPVDDPASSDSRNTASYDTLDSRYAIKYNVETVEDLLNCTESRDGNMAVVLSEDAIYQCSAGRWAKVTVVPEKNSSSSITPSGTLSSSSCNETSLISSSSGKTPLTSSSSSESGNETAVSAHCFEPWHGNEMVYQILTGYDNGSETSGYWYSYADDADGGASKVIWPVPATESPDVLDAIIDFCGGVCGTFELAKGSLTYDPYAGVGFNIAGVDENGYPTTVDASAMGGIRVTYTSDITMALELGLGEKMERNIGYDVPFVTLAKSFVATVKEFKWSQFKQAGWGTAKITGEEAAKILASIRFKMQGKDGTQGKFNIMSIDAYNPGDCAAFVPPVYSSSSKNMSSSSSKPSSSSSIVRSSSSGENAVGIKPIDSFETWSGADGMERISTGFFAEKEDGGYWYEYNDSEDGGKSSIIWPEPLGNEYDAKSFLPVIDIYGGVYGTYQLNAGDLPYNPYVGVGFDLAGHDANGNLVLADASSMEGICVGYYSDAPITVEMGFGETKDRELEYDVPLARLPKSTAGTYKEFKWSDFKQAGWGRGEKVSGEQAAKTLGSLKFKIQEKDGSTGNFNIMAVGPYRNGNCSVLSMVPVLP